ncbi:MAG TPA: hypothetical protein VLT33_49615 [Labilithrix sp.]|nr:hypothetical protein [Labilithrix sp.]
MAARRALLLSVLAVSSLLLPRAAEAQLHWDAAAQAGVMKRVLVSRPAGAPDAGFGPVGQLTAHVALFPLVRVGGYLGRDISPMGGDVSARDLTWGGLRAKLMSPWPRGALRAWLFAGFGVEGVYARSTARSGSLVDGAGGHFFEVPFGLGGSYTFRKPFALCAELGMRAGFGHSGSAYQAPGPQLRVPGQPDGNAPPAGTDRFAIGLTVGVMLDL